MRFNNESRPISVLTVWAAILASFVGLFAVVSAQTQSASGDCGYWIDGQNGAKLAPGAYNGLIDNKFGFEINVSGVKHVFVWDAKSGSWIDGQTGGKLAPGAYNGLIDTKFSFEINVSGVVHTFVWVPCPPPTPTATPTPAPNPTIVWDDPFDIFFGYSYNRAPAEAVKNLNGINGQFQINLKTTYVERGYSNHASPTNPATERVPKRSIGIAGEFTAAFGSTSISGITASGPGTVKSTLHRFLYLFGPQFNFMPSRKTRLFVHPLFGGVHDSGSTTVGTVTSSGSASAFAMAFGGGLDIAVSPRIGVRPFQFDYVPTHFGSAWQNNFQFSAGIVFRSKNRK